MADLGFEGRVAVVTGGGAGIGRHYALLLASRGASVVVNDLGATVTGEGASAGSAEAVAAEIADLGGTAVADTNSVATPAGGQAVVQSAMDAFGTVDILINNAGILRDTTFHQGSADDLDAILDVHVKGAFYTTGAAWESMCAKRFGRVLNTTSIAGLLGLFGHSNYGTAKAALFGLTRALALEGVRYNIRVNAIAPIAKTRMSDNLGWDFDRFDPALVAPVAAWLVHADCPVTGEVYSAGAGYAARYFVESEAYDLGVGARR